MKNIKDYIYESILNVGNDLDNVTKTTKQRQQEIQHDAELIHNFQYDGLDKFIKKLKSFNVYVDHMSTKEFDIYTFKKPQGENIFKWAEKCWKDTSSKINDKLQYEKGHMKIYTFGAYNSAMESLNVTYGDVEKLLKKPREDCGVVFVSIYGGNVAIKIRKVINFDMD